MSEVEFHVRSWPPVWTARLNKLWDKRRWEGYSIKPQRQTDAGTDIKVFGLAEPSLLIYIFIYLFFKENLTFSTRSIKKSLTSFVLVSFAAMLMRPLERFCRNKITFETVISFSVILTEYHKDTYHLSPWNYPPSQWKLSSFLSGLCRPNWAEIREERKRKQILKIQKLFQESAKHGSVWKACSCYLLCWSSRSLSVIKIFSSFSSCKNSLSRSTSMSSTMLSTGKFRHCQVSLMGNISRNYILNICVLITAWLLSIMTQMLPNIIPPFTLLNVNLGI